MSSLGHIGERASAYLCNESLADVLLDRDVMPPHSLGERTMWETTRVTNVKAQVSPLVEGSPGFSCVNAAKIARFRFLGMNGYRIFWSGGTTR